MSKKEFKNDYANDNKTCPNEAVFSSRLKSRREDKGKTQAELARLVWPEIFSDPNMSEKAKDTKRKCIVGYENGKFPKDPEIYIRLCKALDCDMGYLFGEYECSTVDVQAISDYTGLSEKAIEFMHESLPGDGETDLVSTILSAFLTPAGVLISSEVGRLLLDLAKYKEFAPAFSEKGSDVNRVFRENTLYRIRECSTAIDKAVSAWVDTITDRRSIIEEIESAT